MSKVNIVVNNRTFTIACDDGQEARVQQLGRYVDERFKELNQAGAAPNEAYMLVLTSLVIADDMFEARDAAEKANMAAANAGPSRSEMENMARAHYEPQIASLRAEIDRLRREAAQSVNNVSDFNRAREEAEKRDAEIAKVVDQLSDKLEGVVKKLKRA
jgi:cell division protein ZapA